MTSNMRFELSSADTSIKKGLVQQEWLIRMPMQEDTVIYQEQPLSHQTEVLDKCQVLIEESTLPVYAVY